MCGVGPFSGSSVDMSRDMVLSIAYRQCKPGQVVNPVAGTCSMPTLREFLPLHRLDSGAMSTTSIVSGTTGGKEGKVPGKSSSIGEL